MESSRAKTWQAAIAIKNLIADTQNVLPNCALGGEWPRIFSNLVLEVKGYFLLQGWAMMGAEGAGSTCPQSGPWAKLVGHRHGVPEMLHHVFLKFLCNLGPRPFCFRPNFVARAFFWVQEGMKNTEHGNFQPPLVVSILGKFRYQLFEDVLMIRVACPDAHEFIFLHVFCQVRNKRFLETHGSAFTILHIFKKTNRRGRIRAMDEDVADTEAVQNDIVPTLDLQGKLVFPDVL